MYIGTETGLQSCWTSPDIHIAWSCQICHLSFEIFGAPLDSPPSHETQAVQLMPAAPMPKETMVNKAHKAKIRFSFLRGESGETVLRKSKVTVLDRSHEFVSQENMEIHICI